MIKAQKTLNKFNRSHAGLRKFLRLLSYGCYHRMLFIRHEITPRSYDDSLRQVRFFVPEKNLQVTRYDKCSYFTLVGDFRHGTKNFYYSSFLLKTLLPDHCLYKIVLLQVLEGAEPLTLPEILNRTTDILLEHNPQIESGTTDLIQSLRRRLNELTESGIVRRLELKNKIFYEKISNSLGELSEAEIKNFYTALKFFRNVSLIGAAGYFLCDSLKNFYDTPEPDREIFQFKNNNFARILDDDILLTIITAFNLGKKILVERENKLPVTVAPVAVETDFLYGRQYLVALKKKDLMRLRVEKITAIKILKNDAEKFSLAREKLREVRLRVKFKDSEERRRREKILTEELPARIVDVAADEFICVVETPDPLQIYPQLWKFQPWAEILSGADGLRERIKSDTLEALKNYAEPL